MNIMLLHVDIYIFGGCNQHFCVELNGKKLPYFEDEKPKFVMFKL